MPNITKEFCYEYFNCKEADCIRRKHLSMNCWDINDVQCQSHSEYFYRLKKEFETKQEACKLCAYYQKRNK